MQPTSLVPLKEGLHILTCMEQRAAIASRRYHKLRLRQKPLCWGWTCGCDKSHSGTLGAGQATLLRLMLAPQTAALMTFIACSRMSLRAVREALRAAEASSSTSIDPTDSEDRFNNAVARRDLVGQQQSMVWS